ncbi:neuronal PAS domain-containing protein 4-like isoform X2 [Oncorhynchus keta]|uniref:neuronal PAS domain-containing protein 4-like isoform X2 n=1 Tax=Oncorhynchus keta TaxID=8018 RepID=UPI00227B5386|nr:neuronal PAS domain-containing protein 4-like isoform X2 [Oncorhynchus keta]
MTVCCELCESPWSSERCSFHLFSGETESRLGLCKRFRSTKGASKARRDQINSEIRNMRTLLPIPQEDQDRLSYLHSMAVITAYIRKSFLYKGLSADQSRLSSSSSYPLYETFLPAVHGFILILSSRGRLVYVSENVSDYLGLSMVDVLQGDTFYDLVESQDVETVRSNLETDNTTSTAERSFVCQMHTSKAFRQEYGNCCSIMVRGRYQTIPQSPQSTPTSSPDRGRSGSPVEMVFLALCTPTVNHLGNSIFSSCSSSFTSLHRPDMSFSHLDESVVFYLGYSSEELIGRSWYSLLHPEDLSLSAYSHKSLMQADEGRQMEMVLRLQHSDLSWSWIYTRAAKLPGNQEVSCCNYIISETEAMYLRKNIHSDAFRASPPQPYCPSPTPQLTQSCCPTRDLKRQREFSQCSSISETENRSKTSRRQRAESNAVFYMTSCSSSSQASPVAAFSTPPYSPTSSHYNSSLSPAQQDDTSSDSLLDVFGYTENLTYYYHCPEGGTEVGSGPSCLLSPSRSFQPGSEQSFHQSIFSQTDAFSPQSCPSSPQHDCPACPADARLVPDCLSVSDLLESSADCPITIHTEDYSLSIQPQGDATSPYSLSVQPQGGATSPYSLSVQPLGDATSPYSLSVQPLGGATSPYSLSVQPQGDATSPYSLSVQPLGDATSPYSLSVQPQGGATSPYSLSVQPQGGATRTYQSHHIPQTVAPPIGGLLTPNPSPTSDLSFLYSDRDKVEISILAQQISSLASSFDLFNTLSPIQTPRQPSSEPLPWAQLPGHSPVPLRIKPELVLDKGVFDSLLKDLSMVQGPGSLSHCYQPQDPSTLALSSLVDPLSMQQSSRSLSLPLQHPSSLSLSLPMQHPSSLSLSLPLQHPSSLSLSLPMQHPSSLSLSLPLQHPSSLSLSLPLDPFHPNLDPFSLRTSCHNQTSELHQLNLPHSLHQDGLVEESMY